MTAYVVGSLVAAAVEPTPHTPIIVQEQTQSPKPSHSPSGKPSEKPNDHKKGRGDDHSKGSDDSTPEVIPPSPSIFDDHGGLDNSGKGSGGGGDDSSSGKGSGDG
jgi:hypothetical protein